MSAFAIGRMTVIVWSKCQPKRLGGWQSESEFRTAATMTGVGQPVAGKGDGGRGKGRGVGVFY